MGTELKKMPARFGSVFSNMAGRRPLGPVLLLAVVIGLGSGLFPLRAQTAPDKVDDGKKSSPRKQPDSSADSKGDDAATSRISFEHVIVSNYVFRGVNIFAPADYQKGTSLSSAGGVPAYQPALKIHSPVPGLSFGLWGSFALDRRNDTDHDGRIEKAAETTTDAAGTTIGNETGLASALIAGTTPTLDNTTNIFRRDENGLKRFDEIDMTIDYRIDLGFGEAVFGFIVYYLPNSVRRGKPVSELYAGFKPNVLPGFEFIVYGETESGDFYINPAYEYEFKLSAALTFAARASAGYAVLKGAQGWRDVTVALIARYGDFHLGIHAALRPNAHIIESVIATGDADPGLAAWLNGNSTLADGLVPDPAKDNLAGDIEKLLIERELAGTSGGYTYTARQKLPRVLGWLSLGYTHKM